MSLFILLKLECRKLEWLNKPTLGLWWFFQPAEVVRLQVSINFHAPGSGETGVPKLPRKEILVCREILYREFR